MRPKTIHFAALFLSIAAHAQSVFSQPGFDPTDLDLDGIPGVAPAGAPGSQIPEVYAVMPGRLLVDRGHLGIFDVSGFTNFLISQGWTVAYNNVYPMTDAALAGTDVLMIPVRGGLAIRTFSESEVAVITSYLAGGHGLWVFHDYTCCASGVNTLAGDFGVSFQDGFLQDSTDNEGDVYSPTIHLLQPHPVTLGVTSFGYYGGCCLGVQSPSFSVAMGDEDTFSSACPTFPKVLALYEDQGRACFSGDITPLHPGHYPGRLRAEEELLLQNIVNWLAFGVPTSVETTTWGSVKALYR